MPMPGSRLPPTPAVSGELTAKDRSFAEGMESSFQLPPAALNPSKIQTPAPESSNVSLPVSPTSPDLAALGRSTAHSSSQVGVKRPLEDFDLPPPPTRTRRIIQMKPKAQTSVAAKPTGTSRATTRNNATGEKTPSNGTGASNSKKKQPATSNAAGKKVARKTAHSLIERRRRSKMNEEFATLKNMIPACHGQDMHKLSILQVCFFSSTRWPGLKAWLKWPGRQEKNH